MTLTTTFTELEEGHKVVHQHYGVGTIVGVDTRTISGDPTQYYRIKTMDSLIWLPVEEIDDAPVRPIAPKSRMEQALEVFTEPPQDVPTRKRQRTKFIKDARNANDPVAIAEVIRDLYARQSYDRLKRDERKNLRRFASRFAREWAASADISVETARERLRQILAEAYPEVSRPLKFRRKSPRIAN